MVGVTREGEPDSPLPPHHWVGSFAETSPDTRLTSPVSADVDPPGSLDTLYQLVRLAGFSVLDHCFRTGLPPGRSSVALRQPGSGAQQLPHPGCLAGEVVAHCGVAGQLWVQRGQSGSGSVGLADCHCAVQPHYRAGGEE